MLVFTIGDNVIISICRRYLLAFAMLLSIITPSAAIDNVPGQTETEDYSGVFTDQELHTIIQEALEPCFNRVLAQLHLLDCMLQDLAFNLANNSSIATKNRSQTIAKIRAYRELLAELKGMHVVVLNEQIVHSFTVITRATIEHLTKAVRRGLDSLQVLDIETLDMETKGQISLQNLERDLTTNDGLIKSLAKLSDNLGLHWYNKVYRTLKHVAWDPAKAAFPYALAGGTLAASAFMAWYYFGGENPKWLREKIGWPMLTDGNLDEDAIKAIAQVAAEHNIQYETALQRLHSLGLDQEAIKAVTGAMAPFNLSDLKIDTKPAGYLARLDQIFSRLESKRYVLGGSVLFLGQAILSTYLPALGHALAKKIKAADHFLMGGSCKDNPIDQYTYDSDITFDDVIGQEDAKQCGRELCQYIKNPELFNRTKTTPPKGFLYHGNTRTGKSYFISALFGEIKKTLGAEGAAFKMIKVSFEEIIKLGIERIMEIAREQAPIIVVIEEIDLLGLQRTNNAQRLAEFMTAMSSCLQDNTPDKTVIVIGTTNNLENLEKALRETGRFGKHIYFAYPTFDERKLYIERELTRTACNLKNFDLNKLARDTEGCSFEKLGYFIKRAFLKAKLYNEAVTQAALERSIDENIRGISAGKPSLDQEQKRLVAAHLAGHAVASILLNSQEQVSKVTLCDVANKIDEQFVGTTIWNKKMQQDAMEHGKLFANHSHDHDIESKEEKVNQCKISLAGHVAETILLGSCGYGYHPRDKQDALNIAKSITCGALDLTTLTDKIRDQYFDAAFELMNKCEKEVTALLEEHRTELAAVMNELVDKLTLDAQQLCRIVLGEESSTEHLDASTMLEKLLNAQSATLDAECGAPQAVPTTGTAAVAA
jgi:ATP-dependent Zn protease